MFLELHAAIRMMHSSHAALEAWAAELWPEYSPGNAPSVEVAIERRGDTWIVTATRGGLAGLSPAAALPDRADEAAFFLEAFERRASLLEALVRVLLPHQLARLERGEPTAPLAAADVAQLLADVGVATKTSTVTYLVLNKAVRGPAGVVPLVELVRGSR